VNHARATEPPTVGELAFEQAPVPLAVLRRRRDEESDEESLLAVVATNHAMRQLLRNTGSGRLEALLEATPPFVALTLQVLRGERDRGRAKARVEQETGPPMALTLDVRRSDAGQVVVALSTTVALSDQHRLRQLEELVRVLPCRVLLVGRDGKVHDEVTAAPGEQRLTHLHELLPPDKHQLCDRYLDTAFRSKQAAVCTFSDPVGGTPVEALLQPLGSDRAALVLRDQAARHRVERELREAVAQRDRWRREVQLRGIADLCMVSSLVYLESQFAEGDMRRLVHRTQRRIRSLTLIHESLLESVEQLRVDFAHYLRLLVGQLPRRSSAGPLVHIECRGVHLPIDIAVPLGLIVDELVQNAFSHAFPSAGSMPPDGPQIWITANRSPTALSVTVRDNGDGLPPGIDPERPTELGLRLVRTLTRQIGGQLHVDAPSPASFSVELPMEQKD